MTITTRAGKNSALTHNELDGNFTDLDGRLTTLGVTNLTNTTADLDISSLIIENDNFDQVLFKRTNQTGLGGKVIGIFQTEFSDALTVGQGTGFWTRIAGSDGQVDGGSVIAMIKDYTDSNNWETRLLFTPVSQVSGTPSYSSVLDVSHDKFEVENTDAIELNSIPLTGLKLKPTAYANLPSNTGSGDDGLVAYLTTDGAGANKFQLIYSIGGGWQYVSDNSTVAAS
jgi:hypothetical protein